MILLDSIPNFDVPKDVCKVGFVKFAKDDPILIFQQRKSEPKH